MPAILRTEIGSNASPIRRVPIRTGLRDWLAGCAHRHRTRADLRDLCPHLLRDLGLTEGEALREGRKPFWQA
jgi:uncharacterized protein YjiS (DUF1127 family)